MTPDMRARVIAEAHSWVNTPYHPHGRVKGVGVDCAMLLAEIYERAGVVTHIDPGYYSPQFYLHRSEELFEKFVLEHGRLVASPQPGDCVLFKYGRCFSHGGVMVSETTVVHAVLAVGRVCYSELTDGELVKHERRFYEAVPN